MSKIINLLEQNYPAAAASGIVNRRCVVADATSRGSVKVPASTAEKTFIGITTENVSAANNVTVQTQGVALVESDGSAVINPGDALVVVGNATAAISGRVKTQAIAAGSATVYQIIGYSVHDAQVAATAGLLVSVLLTPFHVVAA